VITFGGGIYPKSEERVTLVGAPGRPVTLRAAGGEHPILDGDGVGKRLEVEAEDKTAVFSILTLIDSRHVVVEGLEIRNSVGKGIHIWNSEHVTVRRNKVHHTWSGGISAMGDHLTFEDNEVSEASLMNKDDLVLKQRERGNTTYWAGGVGTWRHQDGSLSKDILWRRNRVHHVWGEGIGILHADGVRVEENVVHDCYSVLIYLDHSRNVVIDRNFLFNSAPAFLRIDEKVLPTGIGIASEFYQSAVPTAVEHVLISNNILSSVGVGIYFWADPANRHATNRYGDVTIAHNLIHNPYVIPVSFRKFGPGAVSLPVGHVNSFSNNIVTRPTLTSDPSGRLEILRFETPSIWKVTGNVLPPEGQADLEGAERSANSNFSETGGNRFDSNRIQFQDGHALGPLGASGFRVAKSKTQSIPGPVKRHPAVPMDFFAKRRPELTVPGPIE